MRVVVGPHPGTRFGLAKLLALDSLDSRFARAHPTRQDTSPTRASASAPEMGSSVQLIFSVDPIDEQAVGCDVVRTASRKSKASGHEFWISHPLSTRV